MTALNRNIFVQLFERIIIPFILFYALTAFSYYKDGAFNRGFALWAKDFVRTYRVILWRVLDYSRDIKKRCTRHLFFMAPSIGLEPMTFRLTAERSTDWAMKAYWLHIRFYYIIRLVSSILSVLIKFFSKKVIKIFVTIAA